MASTLPSAGDCCTPCDRAIPTIVIAGDGSGSGAGGPPVFDIIEDLRDYSSALSAAARFAIVLGETTPGDGNGHQYWWDETGTDADNGASVIRPNDYAGAGIWRQYL